MVFQSGDTKRGMCDGDLRSCLGGGRWREQPCGHQYRQTLWRWQVAPSARPPSVLASPTPVQRLAERETTALQSLWQRASACYAYQPRNEQGYRERSTANRGFYDSNGRSDPYPRPHQGKKAYAFPSASVGMATTPAFRGL